MLSPGSWKRTVDLESMAFSQGGHLVFNRKCGLPEGSFKQAKKGYEEIYVHELVPVSDMLAWAQEAFTVPKPNRVQSRLYPIAFGTDETILLCTHGCR